MSQIEFEEQGEVVTTSVVCRQWVDFYTMLIGLAEKNNNEQFLGRVFAELINQDILSRLELDSINYEDYPDKDLIQLFNIIGQVTKITVDSEYIILPSVAFDWFHFKIIGVPKELVNIQHTWNTEFTIDNTECYFDRNQIMFIQNGLVYYADIRFMAEKEDDKNDDVEIRAEDIAVNLSHNHLDLFTSINILESLDEEYDEYEEPTVRKVH